MRSSPRSGSRTRYRSWGRPTPRASRWDGCPTRTGTPPSISSRPTWGWLRSRRSTRTTRTPSSRARSPRLERAVSTPYVGQPVRRVEDARFLRGRGHYVDDLNLPGMLHAAFLRSPHAHARLVRVDVETARRREGVVAVLDGPAMLARCRPVRAVIATPGLIPSEWPVLAVERVR